MRVLCGPMPIKGRNTPSTSDDECDEGPVMMEIWVFCETDSGTRRRTVALAHQLELV